MNEFDIFSAIGETDDDILARAEIRRSHRVRNVVITTVSAAVACLVIAPAVMFGMNPSKDMTPETNQTQSYSDIQGGAIESQTLPPANDGAESVETSLPTSDMTEDNYTEQVESTPPSNADEGCTDNATSDIPANVMNIFNGWKDFCGIGDEVKLIFAEYSPEQDTAYFTVTENITAYFENDASLENTLTTALSKVYGTPFERTMILYKGE